jgi:glutamine amidotransferase
MQVTVVDYGAGNIQSVLNAVWRAGADPVASSDADVVRRAERVVLPGVGAAGAAVDRLRGLHLDDALGDVKRSGRPVMGICVGMQVMADDLYEYGHHKGLGWMRGNVKLIEPNGDASVRVPHIGWQAVESTDRPTPMIGKSARDRHFYFCHSYCLSGDDGVAVARVTHGLPFTCAVQFDNVFACQFHPEKSQIAGELLLRRFLDWRP